MPASGAEETPRQVAVVFNPASGTASRGRVAERRRAIQAVLAAHGVKVLWYVTSKDDTGRASTQLAIAQGADVVLVSGGDGTVMACAGALAGTAIPLAIVPSGTGNIIAESLRLPAGLVDSIEAALHGRRRRIDVGKSGPDQAIFATSIGIGAAVMRDTSPALKARAGMLAYALGAARHLRDPSGTFRLLIDDEPLIVHKSDGVLVGNFGQLMSKPRLPRTALDDGLLEVGILRIRPLLDWLRQNSPILTSPRRPPLDWYQARRVTVDCDRPQPTERDGDWVGSSSRLVVEILPHSLTVCVPEHEGSPPPMRPLLRWAIRDARKLLPRRPDLLRRKQANIVSCSIR